ncbi:DUF432 domain-containing protein [Thermococcus barossii]|uniref:DUF432 domain-containing protein n=1 Tax=Thermococcus barossii TaxID=54077 RepID=A0A2Z2MPV4_9EURY|nr:DUF432 domain-containing protein [Thermococcus barossii]ASJ03908.1 hypothetical protein A3L01_00430 [Thermococcus barossii]
MFGEHELKTQFIKIGEKKVHIVEEKGDVFKYRRDDVEVMFKGAGNKLEILPAPATGYGVKLLMIDFGESVVVPPGEKMEFFLSAPVEVDVRLGDVTIDHFNLSREKYALYGTPEVGAIARYWRSRLYISEPNETGVVKVHINNGSKRWWELDHLVIYLKDTVMYYSEERAYYPLIIVEFKTGVPEINNTGEPPKEGLKPTKEPLPLPNFVMRW